MNLNDIRAFVAVADTGSVNRAAISLRLTQPAISRRLQNLEAALGITLLGRHTKPPALTAEGRLALEHCREILKAVDGLTTSLTRGPDPVGPFRLGIAHGLADTRFSRLLQDLHRRFPRVGLQVTAGWTGNLLDDIQRHAFDAIVALVPEGRMLPAEVGARPIGQEDVVVAAAAAAPLPAEPRLADLATFPWILNPDGCDYRAVLQSRLESIGEPLRLAAEVIGSDLQLSLIARGLGLGLVPERRLCRRELAGLLRAVRPADSTLAVTVTVIRGRQLGRLGAVVDELEAGLQEALVRADEAVPAQSS